jgi:predicted Zn-dependent peptidase
LTANPLDSLESRIQYRKLDNGITVLGLDRGYSPTLTLIISFRVGSVDESYRTAGAAHMLEHMLFKGTDRIGTKDYAAEKRVLDQIEKVGESLDRLRIANPEDKRVPGLQKQLKKLQDEAAKYVINSPYDKIYTTNGAVGFNASTSRDTTQYFVELPASKLEMWAQTESERLRNPVMREYYRERQAVTEERLMRFDSKGTESLYEKFLAAAFIAHPYRHPTIGWASNVGFLSLRDVRNFYRTRYTPQNMTITVVGKQNVGNTFAVIEKYFGKMESGIEEIPLAIREPAHAGERRLELHFDSSPFLLIGYNKPTFPSRADFVCDIISGILSEGKTSRLYRSLVLEKKIAASVDAMNGFPGARYDNLFVIAAAPRHPHTPQEVESAVYEELARLRSDLSQEEIAKIITRTESSMIFDLDSNKGIAHALAYYQTAFGDWRYVLRYLNEIRSVSVKEVADVMDRYFTRENRTVGILLNRKEKASAKNEMKSP